MSLRLRLSLVVASLVTLCIVSTPAWADESEGWLGGRLVLKGAKGTVSFADVASVQDGAPIRMVLLKGRRVLTAQLDDDGYFVARGQPGSYRLEYLTVGERAEFFRPITLRIKRGSLTCAGAIVLSVQSAKDVGANNETPLKIDADCSSLTPRLLRLVGETLPVRERKARRAGSLELLSGLTVRDLLIGLRIELEFFDLSALRAVYALRLKELAFLAEFGVVDEAETSHWDAALGVGHRLPYRDLLVFAHAGRRWPRMDGTSQRTIVGASVRQMGVAFGLGARFELLPARAAFITIDVAPLGFLGGLL